MSWHPKVHIGLLTCGMLGSFCQVGPSQDVAFENDAEPISYAAAPEFWQAVERVVHSGGGVVAATAQGERNSIREREALANFKGVSLPQTRGFKRVRVFPDPHYPKHSLLGFLIREEPDKWVVFTSNWRMARVPREKHTKIEPSDLNHEIDVAVEFAAMLLKDHPGWRDIVEIPAAIKDGHNHFNRPDFLFDLAYLAFASDRKEAVEPLVRAAFDKNGELLVNHLYDELAWRQFEAAVLDLNTGAGRAGLSRHFQRIATEFSGGEYKKQATEYADKLQRMAAEDAAWQKPQSLPQLSLPDRIKALIFQLRDCNAVQWSQPGSCWIPSIFQPVEEVDGSANAADLLIELGFDAVPALIEALDDSRLTRSYGYDREFIPWRYVLEVRDAAIQSLVVIADGASDKRLYHANNTGQYFSNDPREEQTATIRRIKEWWAEAKAMGEGEWLRMRLRTPGQSRPMLLRRLVNVERDKAVPDVRKWLAEEKYSRTYAYQLLIRAGGDAIFTEVQTLADPAKADFEFPALFALKREHLIEPAEYKTALLKRAEVAAKRDSGKLPGLVLTALTETGDRQCTLMVAERLRAGKLSYDREMQGAFGKINAPTLGPEVAGYVLPFFDIAETGPETGWRQYYMNKPDLYRVKDEAAFTVNRLLGYPLPDFWDVSPPERDAEIEKLRKICGDRGIQPAFTF